MLQGSTSLARLQAAGVVLPGLQATPDGVLYGSPLWRLAPPAEQDLPWHRCVIP
jgi:hypothetical protein